MGGEWSNLDKQTREKEEEEGRDVFRWKRKYSSPPLATFSLLRLPRPRFFLSALLYIFYTAIFHIPDNSLSFISVPSISLVGKNDEKKIGLP